MVDLDPRALSLTQLHVVRSQVKVKFLSIFLSQSHTHSVRNLVTAHTLENVGDVLTASIPLKRIGKPEDVAGTALYLASPAGAFVNGATIVLDGGMLVSMSKL